MSCREIPLFEPGGTPRSWTDSMQPGCAAHFGVAAYLCVTLALIRPLRRQLALRFSKASGCTAGGDSLLPRQPH